MTLPEPIKDRYKGHVAVLIVNLIFGLNIPICKSLLSEWMTPLGFTLIRLFFGAAAFWVISIFTRKEKVSPKDLFIIFWGGFFGFVVTQYALAYALEFTSPVNFSLIIALSPVFVMILAAIFLKEQITQQKILGVILGISGVFLIVLQSKQGTGGSNHLLGIIISLFNIFSYSIYMIITRSVSQRYSPTTLMKWMFLFATLVFLPFGYGDLDNQRIFSAEGNAFAWFELMFVLVFSTALAYFLMPIALKILKATTVSVYMNLQPIVASSVAIIANQDRFTWDKPIAALLVMCGVLLVTQNKSTFRRSKLKEA